MISSLDSVFTTIAPLTYWAISAVWLTIFVLLTIRFYYGFRANRTLTLLILILAIDAIRTVVESLYFGSLFNSYFGILPPGVQIYLSSPFLLTLPKLVNLVSGLLVLFLIVRRWIPSAQARETESVENEKERNEHWEKQRQSLIIAQAVAKVGSWETDFVSLEVEWSEQTYRIFGVDPAIFVPTHLRFLDLVYPSDREDVDAAFLKSFDSGESCQVEHRIQMADGSIKHVIERWQTLVDSNGKRKAIGTCQDISDIKKAEETAKDALHLLSVASRAAQLGGWSYDSVSMALSWSDETRRIHEVDNDYRPTVEEGIRFYAPEYRNRIESVFKTCLTTGEPFSETLQILTARGNRVWVKSSGIARRDSQGKIIAVHGSIQDVSERVAREQNLQLLQKAISRLNDIVLITDAVIDEPGPKILYVNDAFQEITKYSPGQAIGRSPRFLQGQNTDRNVLDKIRSSMSNGRTFRGEIINYTKDNQELILELEIFPITDARGEITNFVSIERDVTERRRTEIESANLSQRLETMIREAKIGILVHRDFKPLVINDELARILGYSSAAEIMQMDDARFIFADDERERISKFNEARLRGEQVPTAYEIKGKKRDGSSVHLENRVFKVNWGVEVAVCAMLTDVTERKRLEEQLRQAHRLEAVGQLTGGVSHDFNNLLTIILGNAEVLDESLPNEGELRDLTRAITSAARRGADLTSRLLSFSRRQPLDPKPTDVAQLVERIVPLLKRAVGEQIDIKIVNLPGLWPAHIDQAQLENAILNLAINSRDAMPEGGALTIDITNADLDEESTNNKIEFVPGPYTMIAVSDTGCGMSDNVISQAFDPFFTTKDVGKGSGLGLSMVYGFVKQSRGFVSIYSEVGVGTTVKLYLPKSNSDPDHEETGAAKHLPTGSEKILLVEDDDRVREYVQGELNRLGYTVVAVANGIEATEVLHRVDDFDLLFTDVVMPKGINGPQLAKIAGSLYPKLAILFTSGYTENAIIHHGRLDQGTVLLSKPYRRIELAEKVRLAIDKASN